MAHRLSYLRLSTHTRSTSRFISRCLSIFALRTSFSYTLDETSNGFRSTIGFDIGVLFLQRNDLSVFSFMVFDCLQYWDNA